MIVFNVGTTFSLQREYVKDTELIAYYDDRLKSTMILIFWSLRHLPGQIIKSAHSGAILGDHFG